jgi:Spy/CpxP family protein refolding chaperone
MNKSILLVGATIATLSLFAASTFAATSTGTAGLTNKMTQSSDGKKGRHGPMIELTDAENTALTSMSDADKKAFLEKKRTEMQAKREANEAIIDKLLTGQALTANEEMTRKTIITERAERKAQKEKIDAIRAKIQAGTTLTTEEQTLVESMPKMDGKKKGGKNEKRNNR